MRVVRKITYETDNMKQLSRASSGSLRDGVYTIVDLKITIETIENEAGGIFGGVELNSDQEQSNYDRS